MHPILLLSLALVGNVYSSVLPTKDVLGRAAHLSALSGRDISAKSLRLSSIVNYANDQGHDFAWEPLSIHNETGAVISQITTLTDEQWEKFESGLYARAVPSDFALDALETRDSIINKARCYGSGTWVQATIINGVSSGVCAGFEYAVFGGSNQIVVINLDDNGQQLVNGRNQPINLFFAFRAIAGKYAPNAVTNLLCTSTVGWLATKGCPGDNSDTQGGTAEVIQENFGTDVAEITVDPNVI
jgi:hypothetical protein